MNRIYQGKVTNVETLGKDADGKLQWQKLPKEEWQHALWQHHQLFQDAVNYYSLALAALASGLASEEFVRQWVEQAVERAANDPKHKKPQDREKAVVEARENAQGQIRAALGWREQVRGNDKHPGVWKEAQRKAIKFSGPHYRIAKVLGLDPATTDFDACAAKVLANCPASADVKAAALLRLLELANDASDLSVFAVDKLPWLCDGDTKKKTDDTAKSAKRQSAQAFAKRLHAATLSEIPDIARDFSPSLFVQSTKRVAGDEAKNRLNEYFAAAAEEDSLLASLAEAFKREVIDTLPADQEIEVAAKRYQRELPLAVLFKNWPSQPQVVEAFKRATQGLATGKDVAGVAEDPLRALRTDADVPAIAYFTNLVFFRESGSKERAVWFDFDLAAFIEAIGKPHRYFQDTQSRLKEVTKLHNKLKQIEEGEPVGTTDNEEDEGVEEEQVVRFGFKDDVRIPLLRELVTKKLGYLAEAETPDGPRELIEYSIQERTLRGWADIRDSWRKLVAGDRWAALSAKEQEDKLWDVVKKSQGEHRDDFGSATLFRALLEPHYQTIWREDGNKPWHAPDPLRAWRGYTELRLELADVERPIRFTPAHAEHSPRYFIMPKMGRFGTDHKPGTLAFTCGVVLKTPRGLEPTEVCLSYAAPRLFRDHLRRLGDTALEAVPWLQPMMQALGLPEPDVTDFANCRVTLQPAAPDDIQLTFPVPVEPSKLQTALGHKDKWNYQPSGQGGQKNFGQFNYSATEPRSEMSLRWPKDIEFAKETGQPRKREPEPWHRKMDSFSCLSVDLGQRGAGAYARLEARCDGKFGTNKHGKSAPTRFIGATDGKKWRAALAASGLFRLPGEDAKVWRAMTAADVQKRKPKDSGQPFDFREELWGDRGRPAEDSEKNETAELMRQFDAVEKDAEGHEQFPLLPADWRDSLTFPEQNDKLLVAARRAQSRVARLHRWCWFLADETKRDEAFKEMCECEDQRLLSAEERSLAKERNPRVAESIRERLKQKQDALPALLVRLANRVLPLRERVWVWNPHPDPKAREGRCHLLEMAACPTHKPMIRGQRGLSFARIEQIEELRKRFQSLNQTLRRTPGAPPPKRRDDSIPDPCPSLLDKLDEIKTQRANQTAHMILAAALGLKLTPPPTDKAALRRARAVHGQYVRACPPVDFIVIENLRAYRTSQGRGRKENWRLMRWCIGHVRDKLRELCEPFGIPVVETPSAYSSRFCARSGVAGFRAVEVTAGFTKHGHWAWLAGKKDEQGNPTDHAKWLLTLDSQLDTAQTDLEADWKSKHPGQVCPKRTALVPQSGGPIFVPVASQTQEVSELDPKVVQADVNAAINLGLRAIADPRLWEIQPRLRTGRPDAETGKRRKGKAVMTKPLDTPSSGTPSAAPKLITREKRKFGEAGIELKLGQPAKASALEDTTNPNYFRDLAGVATWDEAEVQDPLTSKPVRLVSGKALWGEVKRREFDRCKKLNDARLAMWRNKLNPMPD